MPPPLPLPDSSAPLLWRLGWVEVRHVGGKAPGMAVRIVDLANAVAVEHRRRRHDDLGSGRHGLVENGIYIVTIDVKVDGRGGAARHGGPGMSRAFWSEHDLGVAVGHFGVLDLAIGTRHR